MSKQIPPSCSSSDPGWQHRRDNAKDQLGPVSQTTCTAGAVCSDQRHIPLPSPLLEERSLKYHAAPLPGLMASIDLFDTVWVYEAVSLLRAYQRSAAQNKQKEIQRDTSVIPSRVCSLSSGTTIEKKKKTTLKFFSAISALHLLQLQ